MMDSRGSKRKGRQSVTIIIEPRDASHCHDDSSLQADSALPGTPSTDTGDGPEQPPPDPEPEPRSVTAGELENQFTDDKLRRLQAVFEEADEDGGGGLDMEEFRNAMRQTMGNHITDEQLDMVFMKVDTNCDGTVDWDEYLTYMLLECRERDQMQVQARQPFPRYAKEFRGVHKDTIVRILYLPSLIQDDVADADGGMRRIYHLDEINGRYVSVSKEGVVVLWCMEMKNTVARRIEPVPPQKSIWVTDIVVMPRANVLVAGTTSGLLMIYDLSGNRFQRMSIITDMKGCPLTMHFWTHPSDMHSDILVIGDDRGSLHVLRFKRPLNKTHLNPKLNRTGRNKFMMEELIRGGLEDIEVFNMRGIHGDTVRQVMYCPNLLSVVSCSRDDDTSLFLGDIERKCEGSYMQVKRGINSFDYCKKLNVIITGGYDAIIRVWNPYITTKPVITLFGHKSPVLHVLINPVHEHVISIAENKDIRVHDMTTQTCLQTLFRKMLPNMGSMPISAAFFGTKRQALIFATKLVFKLQPKIAEIKELTTQSKRLSCALYNPIFHQVVTGGEDSQVCVWNVHTGAKVMQFKAHTVRENGHFVDVEITAMVFGPRYRRLITGAQNGSVKIWNFNNGGCLRELPTFSTAEVTCIVCPRERIATGGWNREVTLYMDDPEDDSMSHLSPQQNDDIHTMALYPPHLIACASHDGTILVWSLETMRLIFFTEVGGSGRAQSYTVLDRIVNKKRRGASGPSLHTVSVTDPTLPYISVSKLLFLPKRMHNKDTAILFAACSDGIVRAYSVHHEGGLKGEFQVTKRPGCSITSLTTNEENDLLITGDADGYIRMWDVSHFCIANKACTEEVDELREPFWEQFTYYTFQRDRARLRKELREAENKKEDGYEIEDDDENNFHTGIHLINSFQAHMGQIITLDYANVHDKELIVSCSSDYSVRLWTINGEFLGIFGQPTLWSTEPSTTRTAGPRSTKHALIPPDVRRVASAATLRVFYGGKHPNWYIAKHILTWLSGIGRLYRTQISDVLAHVTKEESIESLNREGAEHSILGKGYKKQMRHRPLPPLERPNIYYTQCRAYRSLPCVGLDKLELSDVCDVKEIRRIQSTYKLSPLKCDPHTASNPFRKVGWLINLQNSNKPPKKNDDKGKGGRKASVMTKPSFAHAKKDKQKDVSKVAAANFMKHGKS